MGIEEFQKQMINKGYYVFPEFVSSHLVLRMLNGLEKSYDRCRNIQLANGLKNTEGTCHHLIGQDESFLDYLYLFEDLNPYTESYFEGKYILNAFGGNLLSRGISYANGIHRDIRSFSGDIPLMLNSIVMLDDFTEENGATWLMSGGHRREEKPNEDMFNYDAFQITGKAGDVVFFNSNMWHRAGENKTDIPRRSVTPMFTRPFYKQQFYYPQFCSSSGDPWIKQILGYNSRTPKTLIDWYKPEEKRMYRSNQG